MLAREAGDWISCHSFGDGMSNFTKSIAGQAALAWLESLGWFVRRGFRMIMASGAPGAERFIAVLRA